MSGGRLPGSAVSPSGSAGIRQRRCPRRPCAAQASVAVGPAVVCAPAPSVSARPPRRDRDAGQQGRPSGGSRKGEHRRAVPCRADGRRQAGSQSWNRAAARASVQGRACAAGDERAAEGRVERAVRRREPPPGAVADRSRREGPMTDLGQPVPDTVTSTTSEELMVQSRFAFTRWVLGLSLMLLAITGSTAVAEAAPVWKLNATGATRVAPSDTFTYHLIARHTGDSDTDGTAALDVTLPPGLTGVSVHGLAPGAAPFFWNCAFSFDMRTLHCDASFPLPVAPGQQHPEILVLTVRAEPSASGAMESGFSLSGGGAVD